MEGKETKIPVPWGFVAAKTYGDPKNQAVLAVHGIQDNCGTFERLMPHLPVSFYYICIDLPSHGRSSRLPGNLPIHTIDYLIVYKLILDHFNRKKYIIMGHSYGGQIGLHFTQVYPEYIIKLILLDTVIFYPLTVGSYRPVMVSHHSDYMKMLKNNASPETQPSYTYEEALTKMIVNRRYGELTREAAEPILSRNIEETQDGKFKFTMDPRLKFPTNPNLDMRSQVALLKRWRIECPLLLLLASETPQITYFKPILDVMRKNKSCTLKVIEGDHDVHNKFPERVAPYINRFLVGQQHKL